MPRYALVALGTTMMLACAPGLAVAQVQTLNENVNNTGIPRQAPGLSMSSIYGLNPCSSGLSVGVTTPLFGIGGAAASIDRECETRNNAALAITALHDEKLAREIMCKIHEVREAAIRVHQPCIEDGGVRTASAPAAPGPGPAPAVVVRPTESSVPRQYAPAMPMRVPPPSQSSRTDPVQAAHAVVPAFCLTPGLAQGLYPECVPGSAASKAALASQQSAMRAEPPARMPSRAPVVDRDPTAEPRAVTPVRLRVPTHAAPIEVSAAPHRAGCVVPSALREAYPECRTDAAGEPRETAVAVAAQR